MTKSNLHELFKLAMWDEHISNALYLATAGRTSDKLLKDKLLHLAGDEKRHLGELQEMHRAICCENEIEVTSIGLPSPTESGFLKSKDGPDMVSFLSYAMEKEDSALHYYLEMSDHLARDPKASATLLHFSAMESDHFNLLKKELDDLKRRK